MITWIKRMLEKGLNRYMVWANTQITQTPFSSHGHRFFQEPDKTYKVEVIGNA